MYLRVVISLLWLVGEVATQATKYSPAIIYPGLFLFQHGLKYRGSQGFIADFAIEPTKGRVLLSDRRTLPALYVGPPYVGVFKSTLDTCWTDALPNVYDIHTN